jgi:hypothetical protein
MSMKNGLFGAYDFQLAFQAQKLDMSVGGCERVMVLSVVFW